MFGRRTKKTAPAEAVEESTPVEPGAGPFDAAQVTERGDRIDLGALWLPGLPGMELRLEVDRETDEVSSVQAVMDESALQLQAFAAPRTSGIWDGVRREIADAIVAAGGTADEVDGPLGAELRCRMPQAGPDGRTVFAPARFLGFDGPRWFLRGVLSGPAAIDVDAAAALVGVFRDVVVHRGSGPMAPREMLPLTMPELPSGVGEVDESEREAEKEGEDDLRPFERGPELTETR